MEKQNPYNVEVLSKAIIKFLTELTTQSGLDWELKSIKFGPGKSFALVTVKIGRQVYFFSLKDEQ